MGEDMLISDEQWEWLPRNSNGWFFFKQEATYGMPREKLEALAAHPQIELKILPKPEPRYYAEKSSLGGWNVYDRTCDGYLARFSNAAGDAEAFAREHAARLNAEVDS